MIESDLPVIAILDELCAALDQAGRAVLVAPPGAGKTTMIPLRLLDEGWSGNGRILMLEPRRVATRAAARRMASLLGEQPGQTVGYATRFERMGSARTRIEVVTEGIFTRRIQADPSLEGVAAVIFDEFHERSLDADLGLALALETRQALRPDLRLLVMSATLMAEQVAALLDAAPIVRSEGKSHPLQLQYRPMAQSERVETAICTVVEEALATAEGDILCFLPGAAEIRRTQAALAQRPALRQLAIMPLFGDLSPRAQDQALAPDPAGRRKIVLSTDIAETSLTIDGVSIVVDAGLARKPAFSPRTSMSRLETVKIAQSAAAQRAGRAARQRPGQCFRLWSEQEQRLRPEHDQPEMMRADLAPLALDLAAWGTTNQANLRWMDPPPQATWLRAQATLRALGAIDADGRITPHGRAMSALPLHPRLAHMIIAGAEHGLGATAVGVAAFVSARDPWRMLRDPDLAHRLRLWAERDRQADHRALAELDRVHGQIANAARVAGAGQIEPDQAGTALALAYPDRIGQGRGRSGAFRLANGRGAAFATGTSLSQAPWIVVADLDDSGADARIHAAAEIPSDRILELCKDAIVVEDEVVYDEDAGRVEAVQVTRLGAILLHERPLADAEPEAVRDALLDHVRRRGLDVLPWTSAARQLRQRMIFAARTAPNHWPDVSDDGLIARLEEWLGPALEGRRNVVGIDVGAALLAELDWPARQELDRLCPTLFRTPNKREVRVDYAGEAPAISVRLQDLLGLDSHPAVGSVPLVVHLLSPAQRPIQVTRDLPGFWRGSYADVRKEMRGRYPKHDWPEDPLAFRPDTKAG